MIPDAPQVRSALEIRPVEAVDARRLLALRNDPFIVSLSRSGRPVTRGEHELWFAQALAAPDGHRIYFLVEAGKTVGALRFDRVRQDCAQITVYLLEPATGRGLGTEAISRGMVKIASLWPITKVLAHIIAGNEASMRAFAKTGFVPASPEEAASGWTMVCSVSAPA